LNRPRPEGALVFVHAKHGKRIAVARGRKGFDVVAAQHVNRVER
jgi:hypothetical protein